MREQKEGVSRRIPKGHKSFLLRRTQRTHLLAVQLTAKTVSTVRTNTMLAFAFDHCIFTFVYSLSKYL